MSFLSKVCTCSKLSLIYTLPLLITSLLGPIRKVKGQPKSQNPSLNEHTATQTRGTLFQKGISYTAWWSGQYTAPGADLSLQNLAETGANWISLVATAYQDSYTSTTIDFTGAHTPADEGLIHVIGLAHQMGLKVMLKPHVDLNDESNGRWRGHIGTNFSTETEWNTWFASYRTFITHYAQLAQTYGADQFCIGTELLGTTHREADWRQIIADVRAVYDGPIIYAALHSGEETDITWWDAVDYIGVDGYYPLNDDLSTPPTVEELEAAWEAPKTILADLASTYGKPIILTELGYRSHHGCSAHPWDSNTVSELDLEEQAFAYKAAFRQLYDEEWIGGIFWWQWHADRFISGPCNDGYSPHVKPAENILRSWYGGESPGVKTQTVDEDRVQDIYTDNLAAGWQNWSWDAVVNATSAEYAHSGHRSISMSLDAWGALSLQHAPFKASQYHWLEFYVRGSAADQPDLQVYWETAGGEALPPALVNYCLYLEDETIKADTWKRVRIPLDDLAVTDQDLVRLNIQNKSHQDSGTFWIDDLRLVGSTTYTDQVFLPLVVRAGD